MKYTGHCAYHYYMSAFYHLILQNPAMSCTNMQPNSTRLAWPTWTAHHMTLSVHTVTTRQLWRRCQQR